MHSICRFLQNFLRLRERGGFNPRCNQLLTSKCHLDYFSNFRGKKEMQSYIPDLDPRNHGASLFVKSSALNGKRTNSFKGRLCDDGGGL